MERTSLLTFSPVSVLRDPNARGLSMCRLALHCLPCTVAV
jgi:hypothetical protein